MRGVTKHTQSKCGTIIAVSGTGQKREFEVLWDDNTQAVFKRRGLAKIDEPTLENQHIAVPQSKIPGGKIHEKDTADNGGTDRGHFLEGNEDDELGNEIDPETYLEGNFVT